MRRYFNCSCMVIVTGDGRVNGTIKSISLRHAVTRWKMFNTVNERISFHRRNASIFSRVLFVTL